MNTGSRILMSGLVCLALAGCGPHRPRGQVVATIDRQEVTLTELNREQGSVPSDPKMRRAAQQATLDRVIARKVLAQAAEKAGIAKSPQFAQEEKRAREALLVQVWQEKIANSVPPPSREEAEKFVAQHPDYYASHKVFKLDLVRALGPVDPQVNAAIEPLDTLDQVRQVFQAHNIRYREASDEMDALDLDPGMLDQVLKLPSDAMFVIPAGPLLSVNKIREIRVEPFVGEPAVQHALQYLRRQRIAQTIQRQFGAELQRAKKNVRYAKGFEPVAPAPGKPVDAVAK